MCLRRASATPSLDRIHLDRDRLALEGHRAKCFDLNALLQAFAGRAVDRWGSFRVGSAVTPPLLLLVFFGFVQPCLPAPVIFVGFMLLMAFRNIAYNTLTSRVPSVAERARFMSLQSSVQHSASAAGNFLASRILWELPDHRLGGMESVGIISMALTSLVPLLLQMVERGVPPVARPSDDVAPR